ncbi:MAG: glycosyl hydrolase 115 family protein [Oscillospiraceae bacterium]|nr:glycosyl hydrolase 115 family protein [Oscillospiraceae bacterium]
MKNFAFIVESEAFEGVKRIAQKVAKDFEKVGGVLPEISENYKGGENVVIFATLDKSPLLEKLNIDVSAIRGKREVYLIKLLEDKTLLVAGSDKRGTIYGMFAVSEFIGVSPLHYWGDAEPDRKEISITEKIETISKEPSVKYRGFFINDEWPCFGSWTFGKFNGFTAEMYDHVFELLLRLKGNYMWPAMWTSSFPLDGPDSANEELADIYGVVMGASHHEPCLRASEEWDKVRGEESIYGNEWNYYTNREGLLRYWEDGLKRSGKYEKITTIGMRGERDSSMLGEDATLKDNIDLLKDIIVNQRALIKKHAGENYAKNPQMLALYKEVEEYFYGGGDAPGLKDWDELDDVICMLCEDNFGFMRTLPTADVRARKGGWGMYYHFDYHGGPISYEWMPSITFERTWEQMSMAYDYGIRDIWIVNVGDLKFNEVSLAYFMALAYDFEKWGTNSPNSINEYTSLWLGKTFPSVEVSVREKMAEVLHGYIHINAMRRPEALNPWIYHPCHYLETDRILKLAEAIEKTNEEVYNALSGNAKTAYYSMVYFPATASINLIRMHLYAGKNRHFAQQGKPAANEYAKLVTACIGKDLNLFHEQFAKFRDGKWKGMELEQHIGFTKWNDDGYKYPLRVQVEPAHKPRISVSRKDGEYIFNKTYGPPMTVKINDFLYAGNDEVILEIANDGFDSFDYKIETEHIPDWLEISSVNGTVQLQEEIVLRCDKSKLTDEIQTVRLLIKDDETTVAVEIKARNINTSSLPVMTFLENNGVFTIEANHFCEKKDITNGSFIELRNYGRSSAATKTHTGGAMKVFPSVSDFTEKDEKPELTYRFLIEEAGDYIVDVWTTPVNLVQNHRALRFMLNGLAVTSVPADFRAGNNNDINWCMGVLDNIRSSKTTLKLEAGVQCITIGALEAGLILERLLIYKEENEPKESYLGPCESFYTK